MASFPVSFSRHVTPSNIERANAWLRNRFPFLLIWGLVLSHSIVEYTTVCILMIYLTNWLGKDLVLSASIINVLDGLSAVFVFLVAYIGDNFSVVVFSSGSYTMGLFVLWITSWSFEEFNTIYLAVALIALGRSSRSSNLQSFLGYQLRLRDGKNLPETGEEQRDVSTKLWWHSAWISGYVIVLFVHDHEYSWLKKFKISALLMGAASMLFFNLGVMLYTYYKPKPAKRLSLRRISMVLKRTKITNKPKKLLLWATFIPYSLVLATGNTLFIHQVNKLDNQIGHNFIVPTPFFFVLKSIICDLVVFLFWYCCRSAEATHRGTVTLVRIGAGMVCGVFCCVIARRVEILRQHSPSVLLLTPQYCLLGLMEGLAGGGLFTYILGRLKGSRMKFAEPFSELVLCAGKFISIMFVQLFGFWIDNSDIGQLDRYFLMLAIISSASFCLYVFWALKYGDSGMNLEQEEPETSGTELVNSQAFQQGQHDGDQPEEEKEDELPEELANSPAFQQEQHDGDQPDEENEHELLEPNLNGISNFPDGNVEIFAPDI